MDQENRDVTYHTYINGTAHLHWAVSPIDAQDQSRPRKTWREAIRENSPLLLPVAHDAPMARIIEMAEYTAYQIGGFALV